DFCLRAYFDPRENGVAFPSVRRALDQGGSHPLACLCSRPACYLKNGLYIVPVSFLSTHVIGSGPIGDTIPRGRLRKGCTERPQVVLANKHHRQSLHRGQVQCLVKRPLVGSPFAEEREHDGGTISQTHPKCRANGNRDASSDNTVSAQ